MISVAAENDFLSSFESFGKERTGTDTAWLAGLRKSAMERFAELGFPTTRDEDRKHTSVAPIVRTSFRSADASDSSRLRADTLKAVNLDRGFAGNQIVFVNGGFVPELSSVDGDDGVRLLGLRAALLRYPDRLEPHLGRHAGEDGNAFTALNTAFLEEGAFVWVAPGAIVTEPIHLVFLSTCGGDGNPTVWHPRALIVAGRESQATVVETYGGPQGETYFTNAVTEIVMEEAAVLDHYKLQRESEAAFHVATLAVHQGRGSRFSNHAIGLGGALVRNDINVRLAAEGAECVLNGLFLARGQQHMDTHTRIDHAKAHCSSRELYKGILDGKARGVFHGTILVREGAQKTDAHQTNKNLLLSREALVHSTPALRIHADDVKCKHGSTTGQLDPGQLFYLRSRGIGEETARSLLTYAFAGDIVGRIKVEPVRTATQAVLQRRLPGAVAMKEAVA